MLNQDKINKMYDIAIMSFEKIQQTNQLKNDLSHDITTSDLTRCGMSNHDINKAIEKGYIIRIKRGHYNIFNTYELVDYGINIIRQYEFKYKSRLCFSLAFAIDRNHSAAFRIFLTSIIEKRETEAFEYLKLLLDFKNNIYEPDYNLYLYLMSFLIKLPFAYREKANNLKSKQILPYKADLRYKDQDSMDKEINLRRHIYEKRFSQAQHLNAENIKQFEVVPLNNLIINCLLSAIMRKRAYDENNLCILAKEKNYDGILEYYDKNIYNLTDHDKIKLTLIRDILRVIDTDIVIQNHIQTSDLHLAIEERDYNTALKICSEHNIIQDINSNTIYQLLINMNDLIELKKREDVFYKKEDYKRQMKYYLDNNKLDNACYVMHKYCAKNDLSKYEVMMYYIIYLNILFKICCEDIFKLMDNINSFTASKYLIILDESIKNKEFKKAKICIAILIEAKKVGLESESINNILNNYIAYLDDYDNEFSVFNEQFVYKYGTRQ